MLNAAETACGVESEDGQSLCLSALLRRGGGEEMLGRERPLSHLPGCDLRQKLVPLRVSGGRGAPRGWGQNVYSLGVQP